MPGGAYGYNYRMKEKTILLYEDGKGNAPSLSEMQMNCLRPFNVSVEENNGVLYVNVKDDKDRPYMGLIPNAKVKYNNIKDGTFGKFPGVTKDSAKISLTIEETKESKEAFDHIFAVSKQVGQTFYNDSRLLSGLKSELRETAEALATENGDTVASQHESLFNDNFQTCLSEIDGTRFIKLALRQFGKNGDLNIMKVQGTDDDINFGAIVSVAYSVGTYTVAATETCGFKCSLVLGCPIIVHNNPETTQAETIDPFNYKRKMSDAPLSQVSKKQKK